MALPLIITSGRYKQSDGDIEIPGTIVTIDSDNAGAGANVDIVANQGSDNNGTIRYNATTNQWEISNDGGTFQSIAGGSNTDTYDRSAVFSVPEGNATLTEANVGIAISAGSVIGLGIICDDAVTAGTITVTVKVGGVSGLVAVLNTTDTTKQSATASSGTYTVASQDQITIEVVTAGGYTNAATAATNLDVRLTVINDASSSSSTASGTLDTAYNGGRTVTVDAGAVILDADIADTSEALTITRQPGSSAAAVGMSITMGSNATGDGLVVTHSGSGGWVFRSRWARVRPVLRSDASVRLGRRRTRSQTQQPLRRIVLWEMFTR